MPYICTAQKFFGNKTFTIDVECFLTMFILMYEDNMTNNRNNLNSILERIQPNLRKIRMNNNHINIFII